MTVATFKQTNYLTQDSSQYKANIDACNMAMAPVGGAFAPHETSTPAMTITVDAGALFLINNTVVKQNSQTSGTITAPSSKPRIDRAVINSTTGALTILPGSEADSPSAPAITSGYISCAQIALSVGQTSIVNANITDERAGVNNNINAQVASLLSAVAPPSVRQTVSAGPVDTSGLPTFLPASETGLNLPSQNISSTYPLVVSAANGANAYGDINNIGISTANLTWSSLTNTTTNYLYVTVGNGALTTGFTTRAPIYQWGGTPAVTNGQATYNIQEGKMYLGNGAAAPQTNLVFVGEAVTFGGNVTATVAYAYNGRYDSGYTATLPNGGVLTTKNHNIGTLPLMCGVRIKCTSAEANYSIDDVLENFMLNTTSQYQSILPVHTKKTVRFISGSGTTFVALDNSTGNIANLTSNKWSYELWARRGF